MLNEVIEEARRNNKSRIFFKVDFAKAYDSVDRNYLLDMMERMNFPKKWVDWMESCISTASANVLVNGSPSGEFRMERGLRQGDPLSPFQFLVAAEGLNLLFKRAVKAGLKREITVGRDKVEIDFSSAVCG